MPKPLSNPQLADLTRFLNETIPLHKADSFSMMDLLVGRWIYWEGREKRVSGQFTRLAFVLFAGR